MCHSSPVSPRSDTYSDINVGSGLHYVQIDLGAVYSVNKVKVWHYNRDGRTYHNTKTQVSSDGVNWYTVFDSGPSGEYEYAETAAGRTYTFTALSVRYVRDWLNGSSKNAMNHWVEIEAYGSRTTVHVGDHFEWSGSTMKKYYYAGGQRIAMRTGSGTGTSGLKWLLSDHLGSTSIMAEGSSGAKTSELRYKPWRAALRLGRDAHRPALHRPAG